MYASAMKFCGAMELCGIGFPQNEPLDTQWPDVEAQMAAQKAGLLVAITREFKPQEAQLMRDKGFAPIYKFTNPRTGNVGCLWVKDFTGTATPVTKLPEHINPYGAAIAPIRPGSVSVRGMTGLDSADVGRSGLCDAILGGIRANPQVQASAEPPTFVGRVDEAIDRMARYNPTLSWSEPNGLDSPVLIPYTGTVDSAPSPEPGDCPF